MRKGKKRIGIKVGSALIAASPEYFQDQSVNEEFIFKLCQMIAGLMREGHQVFLVTSGAVACDTDKSHSRALRAAIGQGRLIGKYIEFFHILRIEAAQMLLLAFELKDNREHILGLLEESFKKGVVPVINANDAANSVELDRLEDFADNDVLFTEICLMAGADVAIFATDSAGLIDEENEGAVIHVIDERNWQQVAGLGQAAVGQKRSHGYGSQGILTKVECGKRLSERGIKTIIANGRADNFVYLALKELSDPQGGFGTVFRFTPLLPGLA